jgi:tRNA A37 N6-isopentenylltransferase MiaA
MYLVVELSSNKNKLYESIVEMNEDLILNKLYPEVKNIREVQGNEYLEMQRQNIKKLGYKER